MAEIFTLNKYYKERFGDKVYKLSLDGGMTCPNRDGKLDTRGCIFCSAGGSGDFAASRFLSVKDQIEDAKSRVSNKIHSGKYIAYFQAYTNTYAPVSYLEKIFYEAADCEGIVGISIATRPDCLGDDVINLLEGLNNRLPVFVELGLQTTNERTAELVRRGYSLDTFNKAVYRLKNIGINIVVHLILGLPYEDTSDILNSINHINHLPIDGVKLQLLHVLRNTDLAKMYTKKLFETYTLEEYTNILGQCIEHLRPDIVIHRMTGDGHKADLIAPLWSGDKKRVMNYINKYFSDNDIKQGREYTG